MGGGTAGARAVALPESNCALGKRFPQIGKTLRWTMMMNGMERNELSLLYVGSWEGVLLLSERKIE